MACTHSERYGARSNSPYVAIYRVVVIRLFSISKELAVQENALEELLSASYMSVLLDTVKFTKRQFTNDICFRRNREGFIFLLSKGSTYEPITPATS